MERQSSHSQRFTFVSDVDFGVDFFISAARDGAFENHLVCILELGKKEWVNDWIQKRLYKRCLVYHPHILKMYDIFLSGDGLCLIFEYPKGENLLEFLKKYRPLEKLVRNLFQQLIFAVDYYHNQGMAGLDISLERVSYNVNSGVLKIIDFGFSDWMSDGAHTLPLPYVAPEQINVPFPSLELEALDIWRCGVLLYCMLFRAFPFCPTEDTSMNDHLLNIVRGRWSIPEEEQLDPECFDLLQRMLVNDPAKRIDLSGIKGHAWYLRDLPDGVLQYKFLTRPNDGLAKKVEEIQGVWSCM